jgi:CubicO group peptidase (beta-lactamase class C family)
MATRRAFLDAVAGMVTAATVAVGQDPARKGGGRTTREVHKPVLPRPPASPLKSDDRINRALAAIRGKYDLPGMIGAILRSESLEAIGAVGVRKLGSEDPMRPGDVVHLGSDTKAMTATMLGMLVEEKKLAWSSTVGDVFPGRAKSLHAGFRGVTLWQLLTHRAGLPANGPWWDLKGRTTTEKRKDLLSRMMKDPPLSKPGTTYAYSNVGYAIAGLMAEQVAGRPWEVLMRERLFEPLGMASAGFGPPGTPGKLDAPWGHDEKGQPIQGDNAPALGPAGTVHATIPDWAKFAALHLRGGRGRARLLKPETFRTLHTPPAGGDYAGGWIVVDRPWAGGKALSHSGSNTMWYCTVWLAPARDFGVLVGTNKGGDRAAKACDQASAALIGLAGERSNPRGRA